MQDDNKGYSLVELIIVVAIMAIFLGGILFTFSLVSGKEAQKCAYNISDCLDRAKSIAMAKSGTNDAYVEITKNSENVFVAQYFVPDSPVKIPTTYTMVDEETLGSGRVHISYGVSGTEINGATKMKITFDRLTGGIKEISVGGSPVALNSINISYGRSYQLVFAKETGKHTIERIN